MAANKRRRLPDYLALLDLGAYLLDQRADGRCTAHSPVSNDDLERLIADEVADVDALRLRSHIADCVFCMAAYSELASAHALLSAHTKERATKEQLDRGSHVPFEVIDRIRTILFGLAHALPSSSEPRARNPRAKSRSLTRAAELDAMLAVGAHPLPFDLSEFSGSLPGLAGVWRRQAQLVADIAAAHGKTAFVDRGTMIYCLFRHAAGDAVTDFLRRRGGGRSAEETRDFQKLLDSALADIRAGLVRRITVETAAAKVPVVGASEMAAYAFQDTRLVGETAIELFGSMP